MCTFVRLGIWLNAPEPTLVTLSEMVSSEMPVPAKAEEPTCCTWLRSTSVILVPQKALSPMRVSVSGKLPSEIQVPVKAPLPTLSSPDGQPFASARPSALVRLISPMPVFPNAPSPMDVTWSDMVTVLKREQ